MLNDEQHEKIKKLLVIALSRNANAYIYYSDQRHHALEEIADIIDPEHWNRGVYMKTLNPNRVPVDVLHDAFQPNS